MKKTDVAFAAGFLLMMVGQDMGHLSLWWKPLAWLGAGLLGGAYGHCRGSENSAEDQI